jgi:hypothetical protein
MKPSAKKILPRVAGVLLLAVAAWLGATWYTGKLFEARRDLSRARYDAWVNYFKLKALAGFFRDRDVEDLQSKLGPVVKAELRLPQRP